MTNKTSAFLKTPKVRRHRRIYWNVAFHKEIGWHYWQRGKPMTGGTGHHLSFNHRPGVSVPHTGFNCDRHRFFIGSRGGIRARFMTRFGWRADAYSHSQSDALSTLHKRRSTNQIRFY